MNLGRMMLRRKILCDLISVLMFAILIMVYAFEPSVTPVAPPQLRPGRIELV